MAGSRDRLITALAAEPPRAPFNRPMLAAAWLAVSFVYVLGATLLTGPLRPGALQSLVSNPRFALELMFGGTLFLSAGWLAFSLAVPGARSRAAASTWLSLLAWLGLMALALIDPPVEPSMIGKREHCALETVIYAAPPLLAGMWLVHRGYVLGPARAALAIGLAAGVLPAVVMQVACMYDPVHAFRFHLGPGALVAACAAAFGIWQARFR